jgi:iron complex outermembrane receptor protein
MIDLQYRGVSYKSQGTTNDLSQYNFQDELHFFNPKMGATYQINNQHQLAGFIGHLGKEPNRNDYVDHATKPLPEFMTDYELSWKWAPIKKIQTNGDQAIEKTLVTFNTNLFWMQYKNQLVLTGALNDVGAPLRTNIPVSYRRGIEWEGHFVFENNVSNLSFHTNLTWSQNQIQNFKETLYDYTDDGFAVQEINHNATAIAFSPQWISGNTLEYIYKNHWGISTQYKWVSEQYLDNTQDENKIISAYHVNDWKLFYQWQQNSNRFEWSLWINNAGNQMYNSNGWTYSYIYGNKVNERFYYPQAGRNYLISFKIEI